MANVGDQYIITIDSKMTNHNGNLYTVSGMNTCVFDDNGLSKLVPYRNNVEYKQGLLDSITSVLELLEMSDNEIYDCFGVNNMMTVIYNFPIEDIVEKTKHRIVYKMRNDKIQKLIKEIGNPEKLIEKIKELSGQI